MGPGDTHLWEAGVGVGLRKCCWHCAAPKLFESWLLWPTATIFSGKRTSPDARCFACVGMPSPSAQSTASD